MTPCSVVYFCLTVQVYNANTTGGKWGFQNRFYFLVHVRLQNTIDLKRTLRAPYTDISNLSLQDPSVISTHSDQVSYFRARGRKTLCPYPILLGSHFPGLSSLLLPEPMPHTDSWGRETSTLFKNRHRIRL